MKLELSQVARWLGVEFPGGGAATGYSIDTRTLEPGDLFFAIDGERADGHEYVSAAFEKGAVGAVVRADFDQAGPLLKVERPEDALMRLAAPARARWARPIVAITGSNGKTTTKNATAAMLSSAMLVSSTQGNLNNELGLPLTLLRIDDGAQVAVVEMGMNHSGEIRRMACAARPNVGIVTNVSEAHVGMCGSVGEVALAKRELIEELDGTAVLNADDPRVAAFAGVHTGPAVTFGLEAGADVRATDIEVGADGSSFRVDGVRFRTKLAGRHAVGNVLAGIAAAGVFKIHPSALVDVVATLEPAGSRGVWKDVGGVRVLDDCYNSNPAAVEAMLSYLSAIEGGRRVAVLGEMRELGGQSVTLHRRVGAQVAEAGVELLIAVSGDAKSIADGAVSSGMDASAVHFFANSAEAGRHLPELLREGDVALFKASRGVELERALESLRDGLQSPGRESGVPMFASHAVVGTPDFRPGLCSGEGGCEFRKGGD